MNTCENNGFAKFFLAFITVISLAVAPATWAQPFTITAISPAHSTTNVPLNAEISITFSAALDTNFRFSDTDLPINIELHPDTAFSVPSISFSADLH